MSECPFCDLSRIANPIEHLDPSIIVFEPLGPVVPGHLLVVPRRHVQDATTDPWLTGKVMQSAAGVAARYESANIITSIGAPATQTVKHLHLHVVPRHEGDGLTLPWTGQHKKPRPKTPEEKVEFRKDWDRRVAEGKQRAV